MHPIVKQENNMNQFSDSVLQDIGSLLLSKQETISVAESVTSGLLQFGISCIKDASKFFQGGITAYNIAQKYAHLKVEPIHALEVNCVSQKVATEMSLEVCERFKSDWGVAVTGYASPVPESDNKTFAYFSISVHGKLVEAGQLNSSKENPADVQHDFAAAIFERLRSTIIAHKSEKV
ncbi:MAG: CinA family protein [Chitinophagaceae bacterium]|nr:MAG: CinA family protein [Chitinophagaceae bacterium]